MSSDADPSVKYAARYPTLVKTAELLGAHLRNLLADTAHIDRIETRAKEPGRFREKASRETQPGVPKYVDPLAQIQDQVGARVIVLYKSDVDVVATVLERYLRRVEVRELVPESDWEFGYFGRHWVFALLDDVIPRSVDRDSLPRFFELQVKTLFQHAWSEANHDLGYKAPTELTPDQRRRFAYTAAQAWGADRVFEELCSELLDESRSVGSVP